MRFGSNESSTTTLKPILNQLHLSEARSEAIYLAVPVTGGIRLWEVAARHHLAEINRVRTAFPEEFERLVLRPNFQAAEKLTLLARKRFPRKIIVNPSLVHVPGWSQQKYRRAWKVFISRFVKMILAATGWQFSYGCVEEVTHALEHDIPVIDESGQTISVASAYRSVASARTTSIAMGLRVQFLTGFLRKLEQHTNVKETKGCRNAGFRSKCLKADST